MHLCPWLTATSSSSSLGGGKEDGSPLWSKGAWIAGSTCSLHPCVTWRDCGCLRTNHAVRYWHVYCYIHPDNLGFWFLKEKRNILFFLFAPWHLENGSLEAPSSSSARLFIKYKDSVLLNVYFNVFEGGMCCYWSWQLLVEVMKWNYFFLFSGSLEATLFYSFFYVFIFRSVRLCHTYRVTRNLGSIHKETTKTNCHNCPCALYVLCIRRTFVDSSLLFC